MVAREREMVDKYKKKKERLGRETTSEICLIYVRKLEVIISVLGE